MKRVGNLYSKLLSEENLRKAIEKVCKSHKWVQYPRLLNKTVLWIGSSMEKRVEELRSLIQKGFEPSEVKKKRRYDANAGKWREISEPRLWPDQCVHHALIQVLEPVMMRGMDHYCCGSIKGRGAHYGIKAVKKWMKSKKAVKWCVEMDIRHFYDSLKGEWVMERMKQLVKDRRVLDLVWRVVKDGVLIGSYCSQWFANTFLQPLDQLIRKNGAAHYIRYMDNFTIFVRRKRTADRIIKTTKEWLEAHGLELKRNWQKFPTSKRLPNALGYRFGKGYTLIRKKNLMRLKDQLKRLQRIGMKGRFVTVKFAQSLLSRLGMLRHCNSVRLYSRFVRSGTQRKLKGIIREYYRREMARWTTSLELNILTA